jgi:hypothetical protein
MGEIADMMLDGTLCERCGEYIGNAVGYPRKCSSCSKEYKKEMLLDNLPKLAMSFHRKADHKRGIKN